MVRLSCAPSRVSWDAVVQVMALAQAVALTLAKEVFLEDSLAVALAAGLVALAALAVALVATLAWPQAMEATLVMALAVALVLLLALG